MFAPVVLIAALFTLPLPAPIAAPAQTPPSRPPQIDVTHDMPKGARLRVDNYAGEVVIRTWNRDAVRVQARHAPRVKAEVRTTPTGLSVRSTPSRRGSVDYDISIPAWMPVSVSGTYNFITVEGAQAEVSAETTKGDVIIKGGTGAIVAKSIQGEVVIEGARGRITASSVNEDVKISGASGDITAETTNGNITLAQIKSANAEVSTVNGDISFDGPPAANGRYHFTTHNGNITATIPESASVTFVVRSYQGHFGSTLRLAGPPRSEVRQGRRHTYTLGSGSAEMEMETFGGNIRVRAPGATAPGKSKEGKKDRQAPDGDER